MIQISLQQHRMTCPLGFGTLNRHIHAYNMQHIIVNLCLVLILVYLLKDWLHRVRGIVMSLFGIIMEAHHDSDFASDSDYC